ncbi:MAG: HAMP domain-containing histidine kinase [Candidatus Melainabacteria bacterium]|nr:HAMP domain-containing histidine kinase [Candidatus Melainabacteria bacterium]
MSEENSSETTKRRRFAPKIVHKGLALVLTPILLESFFFFQLSDLVTRAEQLAISERRQSTIVEHMNWLMSIFATASGNLATYIMTGNKMYAVASRESRVEIAKEFDELERLVGDDPRMKQIITELKEMSEDEFKRFEHLEPPADGANYADTLLRLQELRPFVKQAGIKSRTVTHLLKEQREYLEKVRKKEAESREKVKEIVLYGVLGNFVVAVLLVMVFLRDITGRLSVLVENARSLPAGETSTRRVSGSDELWYLDNVLHDAAQKIREAQEDRSSIMEMVAHDLRSPLMSSQVALDLLTKDSKTQLGPSSVRHVETIKRNITRLVSLVSDLLTVEKLEAGRLELDLEEVEIGDVVEEALQSVGGLANQKHIQIVNETTRETVTADRARVIQVLVNYLSNAIKFSPEGSSIAVFTGRDQEFLVVSVQDQGPGISEEDQDRLFSKFYQSKEGKRSKGFGLGLAICKLVIESHGGEVGVDSRPRQGSRFWFALPVEEA